LLTIKKLRSAQKLLSASAARRIPDLSRHPLPTGKAWLRVRRK
jgi:hypothetical protein